MAADEWQLCAQWLVQCRILPDDHRATLPDAVVFDLAQALRDGVLICHLLNNLSPGAVDLKDFSPRPQLSQFLCLKNIRTFLHTCKNTFGLRDQDLFEPPDLFDVKDFKKVLTTLSKLSKSELAQQKFRGFPTHSHRIPEHSYYNALEDLAIGFPPDHRSHRPVSHRQNQARRSNDDEEEDIYGNLPRMALEIDLDDNEEIYDRVYQEDDEEIYEDLCSRRNKRESARPSELPPPVTKKDHCIKELHDTEKNYVDALRMLVQLYHLWLIETLLMGMFSIGLVISPGTDTTVLGSVTRPIQKETHFTKPLKDVIPQQDRDVIFAHIEKLLEIHTGLQSDLQQACLIGTAKISEVFVKWKSKLLIYGDYCSNLPKAQEKIDEVFKRSEAIKAQVEACERKANEGKFKLRDLLHVPMQRVLKYHLLLRELIRQTEKSSEEMRSLEQGLEAMMDLSLYVNEVKRDNETIQLITEIQTSIGDLQMPPSTSLTDYGRLQKDGELRVKNHLEPKTRPRYVFLFDKVMLMCKSKGETYNFKEAIILASYKIDETSRESQVRRGDKWNCAFIMVKRENRSAYTFYAKTEEMRRKWIEAIKLSLENAQPPDHPNFVMHTFSKPTECSVCGKLLRGVFFQGYLCQDTNAGVHKECIGKEREIVPAIPPRYVGKVKALCDYIGNPSPGQGKPALTFKKDDIISVTNSADPQWYKGIVRGTEGWFPQHLVKEEKLTRKPSYVDVKINPTQNGSMLSPPRPHKPGGGEGYVNIDEDGNLSSFKWYVGNMTRETAIEKLRGLQNGTFLIRVSENPGRRGGLSLSIKYDNQVRHIRVEQNAENYYYLADTKFFNSLPDLVEYYQQNSLKDSFPGVDTTLMYPFKSQWNPGPKASGGQRILSYAVAVYDYAATATSQLSLCRGDRVAIYSKTGSDKGWWKGEHCASQKSGYFPLAYVREEEDE